jgi:S4 domain protein YaaA
MEEWDMQEFPIKGDYITLGQLLKAMGISMSGGDVKEYLKEGKVLVNDQPDIRRGRKLIPGDIVHIPNGEQISLIQGSTDQDE